MTDPIAQARAEVENKIHTLKTWPEQWDSVNSGEKKFEFRKDDRGFKVGDVLVLYRYDPESGYTSGSDGIIIGDVWYSPAVIEKIIFAELVVKEIE